VIAIAAAGAAAFVVLLALIRLVIGPTLYDRALAVKSLAVRGALAAGALAVAGGETGWIDAAFALLLGALVLIAAVAKVFRARTFQAPLMREEA
jgi:multisubunit Na+/H+ antiporter MnhF subunit